MKRLFDVDPLSGATETFEYDESEGKSYIHRVTDVSPIIEDNKRKQTNGTNGFNKARDNVHVAHIPSDVMYIWLTKYGVRAWDRNHWPAVKRLLNSNEWRYLRTSEIIL